jgi:putative hemolysin
MLVLGIILSICLAGLFAGLETGLIAASQLKIYENKEKGHLSARSAYFLLRKPERLLATTLIGTNIVIVTATILLIILLGELDFPEWAKGAGSFLLTLVILIFSEIIPKSFFRNHADAVTVKLAPILVGFYLLFIPISVVLNFIIKILLTFIGKREAKSKIPASREDLYYLIKLRSKELGIPMQDQKVISDIFNFRHTKAREVMIPFHELPLCHKEMSFVEIVALAKENGARFIPIYEKRMDNIVSYIDIEDLFYLKPKNFSEIMKEAVFYPETKPIPDLLLSMNKKNLQVVFLSDEYGLISGMITSNEIIADIIGFIPGEINGYVQPITPISKGRWSIIGTTDIEEFIHTTGIMIEKGSYDTIGGYICDKLGEIPAPDTVFEDINVSYKIIESNKRCIMKIEVWKKQESM